MHKPSMVRRAGLLLAALAAFVCAGCASFSQATLPKRDFAELERQGKLPPITYEFTEGGWVNNLDTLNQPSTVVTTTTSVLQARVHPIFRRCFVESACQKEPGEWHLDMYYRETARNPAVTYTLVTFFIISLGIVPAYSQDDLYLEVRLKHGGETVKQFVYEESVSTWIHWFMLPWAFSDDPIERKAELVDNMILNLVSDLRSALPPAAPPAPAP